MDIISGITEHRQTFDSRLTKTVVVYTCVTKNYDRIRAPSIVDERIRYFAFTDNPSIAEPPWEAIPISVNKTLGPIKTARSIKILHHLLFPDAKTTVWVDGNIDIIGDLFQLTTLLDSIPLVTFKHPLRDCAYDEGEACIVAGKDSRDVINKQLERYRKQGYPKNQGLIESNVLIRNPKSEQLRELMETWWREIEAGSHRDQLSFNYASWQTKIAYETIGEDNSRGSSSVFSLRRHHIPFRARLIQKLRSLLN